MLTPLSLWKHLRLFLSCMALLLLFLSSNALGATDTYDANPGSPMTNVFTSSGAGPNPGTYGSFDYSYWNLARGLVSDVYWWNNGGVGASGALSTDSGGQLNGRELDITRNGGGTFSFKGLTLCSFTNMNGSGTNTNQAATVYFQGYNGASKDYDSGAVNIAECGWGATPWTTYAPGTVWSNITELRIVSTADVTFDPQWDNFEYFLVPAPTVTGISPTGGTNAGGTSVTITGTGFVNGATVTIGGVSATGVTWSDATSISATTPAGTAGARDVVVTNPDTQTGTLATGFTYVANTSPTFVGATTSLTVNRNASATDIKGLLHVSDGDSSQTETWTVTGGPSNGTLSGFPATGSSGNTDITPAGTITYTPTAGYSGSDSFTVQVSDGIATATRTIAVTVTAPEINIKGNNTSIAAGDAAPSGTDHTDFGSQSVCSGSIVRTFTIENTGNSSLTIASVNLTGTDAADFTVTATPSSPVAAAGSTTFQVTFNPSALGTRTATITVNNDDSNEGSYDFAIQGTGIDPEVNVTGNGNSIADGDVTPSAADHTDFGAQSVASGTIVRTFTIQNTGNSNLTLGTVTIAGTHAADFSVTAGPSSPVSAAGSTTFQITFDPSAAGTRSADVSFTTNDCDEATYNFAVQGTGLPTTTVSSAALSGDTGVSSTDFITTTEAQTISGTLSANLATGESVEVSYNGGSSWSAATTYTVGSTAWSTTTTLSGSDTFQARVSNAGGGGAVFSHSYVLDTTLPNAPSTPDMTSGTDLGSSSTDNITSTTTPTFTGTAEANSTVTLYDTDGTTVLGTATATGGNWSITSSSLSVGAHTLTAKATDTAGNVGVASSGLSVTIDTSAPGAPSAPDMTPGTDLGSSSTDNITSTTTPTFIGTAEANSTVKIYDTNGTTLLGTGTADGSGNWSITTSALSAGAHTVTAKATDTAGNTSSASAGLAITIDATASAPTGLDLATGSDSGSSTTDNITSVTTPVISGGGAELGATVTLYDTDGTTVLGTATADGSGNWSITVSTLSTGAHTLTAKQADLAGNVSAASAGLAITIDTTAPTETISSTITTNSGSTGTITSGGVTKDNTLALTGTYSDANGVSSVQIYDGATLLGSATLNAGNWSYTTGALSDADHSFTAVATDTAGNTTTTSAVTATVNTSAPTAAANPVEKAGNTVLANGMNAAEKAGNLVVTASLGTSGAVGGDTIELLLDGAPFGTPLTHVLTAGEISAGSYDFTFAGSSLGADGTKSLTTKVTDVAGNVGTASAALTFTLDSTAPTAATTPVEKTGNTVLVNGMNAAEKAGNLVVTASLGTSGAVAGDIIELLLGGASFGTPLTHVLTAGEISAGSYDFTVAGSALGTDGSKSLTSRVTDIAGNVGSTSAAMTFTLDSTLPTISNALAGQTVNDNATNSPFATMTFADANTVTVQITLDTEAKGSFTTLNGFTNAGGGVYTYTGTAANATTAVQGLVFTPTANRVTPGSTETTTFTVLATDAAGNATSDATTTVVATSINDAPVLNAALSPALNGMGINPVAPSNDSTTGSTLVSALVGGISDADTGAAKGIAVTASDTVNGTLYYSTNGGTTWAAVGAVANNSALLLASDANTRLYYQSNNGVSGNIASALTFRAWDRTSGAAASKVDTTTNGNATAFSTATDTASIAIYPPPTLSSFTAAQAVDDNAAVSPFAASTIANAGTGNNVTATVALDTQAKGSFTTLSGFTDNGNGSYTLTNVTATAAQVAIRGLVFTPAANRVNPGLTETTTFTLTVTDVTTTVAATDATTTVVSTSINDAPAVGGATAVTNINDTATATPFSTFTISDADAAQTQTLTVTLDAAAKGALSNLSGGSYNAGTGVYTFTGTAAQAQGAIRALVFTPTANRVATGSSETTIFTVNVNDGIAVAVSNNTTTVISTRATPTAPPAPIEKAGNTILTNGMNAAEKAGSLLVTSSLTGSGAVAGDTVELLLSGASFGTPLTRVLTGTDITAGKYDFTVAGASLGADGSKSLTTKITNAAGSAVSATGLAFTLDSAAPLIGTAAINGTQLVLTYTETSSGIESGSTLQTAEYVVKVGGSPVTVSLVALDAAAKTVTMTLAAAVLSTDTVTVSYTANGTVAQELQDVAGNLAANLVNQAVTNNTLILQTIGAISFTPSTLIVAGTTTAGATASSGLTVSFSSLTTDVCTVSGTTVTGVTAGICTIVADQAGDAAYAAAPQVTKNITVAAAANKVHLDHLGTVTDYTTIQSAVDASADGDTVNIDAGTFVEQVTVTKAITLQGAGSTTIIQAPVNASLIPAIVPSLRGATAPRYAVLGLETATAGSGTVTVKDLSIDGNYEGFAQTVKVGTSTTYFIGIATFNTNATIDNVAVKRMAAGPLDGSFAENGWGIGFGILAEGGATLPAGGNPIGGAAAPNVTVTIQNSTIDTFQKAGIIAWGPNLNAIITNNHISGSGIYGTSGQNGMQIGSGGNRTNTTATISGNTIDNLGAPDSLAAAGYPATGILPVTAGAVEAFNNTITLDPGASANSLIGINADYSSAAANLHDNTLNGMSVGIQISSPLITAIHQIVNNTLNTTGGNPVVFHYDPFNNGDTGGETIANFATGYAIRVVGENFTSGTVTTGNGTGLAANSMQTAVSGGNTALYIDTTVANSGATAPLAVTLYGSYLLGNFVLSGEYIRFTKIDQAISFADPGSQTYGTSPTLTATSDSGLAVSFTSGTTGVCTITSGGTLTFVTAGPCTINSDQAGSANHNAAAQVSRTFTVNKATATVTLGSLSQNYDGTSRPVTAGTTPTGKSVIISYTGTGGTSYGPSATAPTNAGSYSVAATISDANYQGSATGTLTIGKASQTTSFGTVPAIVYGSTGTVNATATSGLAVSLTSTTPAVCSISGSTVTGLAAGTCTIAADQSGTDNFNAATQAIQSITIAKAAQTIAFGTAPVVFVGTTGTVSATATSGLAVSFTSATPLVCTISGTTVTGIFPGTCTIAANQTGNGNYNAATQATQSMTVVVPLSLFVSTLSDGAVTTETTLNVCGLVSNPAFLSSLTVNGVAVHVGVFGLFSYPVQLLSGANTITVIATSTAGDVITDSRTITLDPSAPHLSITYPPDLKTLIKQFLTVTGTISDLFHGSAKTASAVTGGTTSVTYTVNGSAPQIASVTDNTYSFDVNLDQGMNTIQVSATDSTGNTAQAKRTVSYLPGFSLAVTDPASDIRTVQGTYLLTGSVADNTSPVSVTVTMDGQTYTPTVVDGAFQQALPLSAAKVYQINVTGTDQNSNTSTVQRNIIRTVPLANGGAPAFSIVDALLALQMSVGLVQPQTDQILRMDVAPMVNGVSVGDGAVNLEDAVVILRMVVGLI